MLSLNVKPQEMNSYGVIFKKSMQSVTLKSTVSTQSVGRKK